MKHLLLLLVSLLMISPAAFADTPDRPCPILLAPVSLPNPKGLIFGSQLSQTDMSKSILLSDAPVKSQGGYGCCWISASLGRWERKIEKKFGHAIPVSENHMILASLFFRIEEGIYYGSEVIQGGWAHASEWMAKNVGLVPESAWKPKADLRERGAGKEALAYLNLEIQKFQIRLDEMKSAGKTEKDAWDFAQRRKSELFKHLRTRYGNFPSSFKVDGVEYTPHSFAEKILEGDPEETLMVYERDTPALGIRKINEEDVVLIKKEKSLFDQFPSATKYLSVTKNKLTRDRRLNKNAYKLYFRSVDAAETSDVAQSYIHHQVGKALEAGKAVHISTAMVPSFYDKKTGVMSLSAFGGDLEKAKTAEISGGHAMLITGVYRDVNGVPTGYRIQNSWSAANGDIGYFYMDLNYFEAFVSDVKILKSKQ